MCKLSRTWLLYQLGLSKPPAQTNWIQLENQPTQYYGKQWQIWFQPTQPISAI